MRIAMIAITALLAAAHGPAQAAIYKCKDSNGRTVFSDRSCAGSSAAPRQIPEATRRDPLTAQSAAPAQRTVTAPELPSAEARSPVEVAPAQAARAEAPAPRTGAAVPLLDGKVVLRLSSAFRYLDQNRARQVLVETWGNPPESVDGVLGMIVPIEFSADAADGWGVVITYADDGYVSDEDAAELNYTELLRDMQAGEAEDNEARIAQGYPAVRLLGWAEQPHYDAASHKIYWAKDLVFGDGPNHTLNYSIRVLGREGVLELNAVADTADLASIARKMEQVVTFAEFTEGNRYADYKEGVDRRAAYGLAALIAGGMAAKKAGLVALAAALAVKFWKLLAIGAVALAGLFKAGGKKKR